jgi:hypothetical protein
MTADSHDAAQAGSQRSEWALRYMQAADDRMKSLGCD